MSRAKDILIVCLGLSSAALALFVWRQHVELQRFTSIVPARDPAPDGTVVLRPARQRVLPLPPPRATDDAAGFAPLESENGDGARARASDILPQRSATGRGHPLAELMENPEFLEALSVQRRAVLERRFAALFRRLNLDAQQLARLKHLLAEKEHVALDVVTVSETSPQGPLSAGALRTSMRAAQAQVEAAIAHSLGSERYAIYRDYEDTLPQRAVVAQLEQRLSYTSAPLTPEQSESLVRVLAENAPRATVEPPPAMSVIVRPEVTAAVPLPPASTTTAPVTEQAVAQAQAILGPEQIAALRDIQSEQTAATRTATFIRQAVPGLDQMARLQALLFQ